MFKFKSFNDPLFGINLNVGWGDAVEFEKYVEKHSKNTCDFGDAAARFFRGWKKNEMWVFFPNKTLAFKPSLRDSYVAHEALHYAVEVMRQRGVKLSQASEEVYAYLVGYAVRRCLEVLPRRNKCR